MPERLTAITAVEGDSFAITDYTAAAGWIYRTTGWLDGATLFHVRYQRPKHRHVPRLHPCAAGPGSDTNVYAVTSTDGGTTWSGRTLLDAAGGAHQWFPWADHDDGGTSIVGWDKDIAGPSVRMDRWLPSSFRRTTPSGTASGSTARAGRP